MSHIAPSIGADSETRFAEARRRSHLNASSSSGMGQLAIDPGLLYAAAAVLANHSDLIFRTQPHSES